MAFFDDLGKKLSQAGQTAVQKTKDLTDIARLNGLISDEERQINSNHCQIGRLYVSLHQEDYESDFAAMVNAIQESERKISAYRQQIQDIKGVVRCEKCGAEVGSNVAFCSTCGAPMPKSAQVSINDDAALKCSGCGAVIDESMSFCTSCGKPTADAVSQAEEPAPAEVPVAEAEKKCPNCGADVEDDAVFCTVCGTKLA